MAEPDPARHNLLIDAIDYLLTRRVRIDICGLTGNSHYEISGERMAEADLIALAIKMGMSGQIQHGEMSARDPYGDAIRDL